MLNVVVVSMLMLSPGAQPQLTLGKVVFDCLQTEARERAQSDLTAQAAADAVAGACGPRIDAYLAATPSASSDMVVAEREQSTADGVRRDLAAHLPALALQAVEKERARR